jgi:putative membrane protein
MIHGYTDHAANERTYLAWVRTGLAVVAFGLLIERIELLLSASRVDLSRAYNLPGVPGAVRRYEGFALILGGVLLIALATLRFARITRLLDDPSPHPVGSVRTELIFSASLVLLLCGYALYLALPI